MFYESSVLFAISSSVGRSAPVAFWLSFLGGAVSLLTPLLSLAPASLTEGCQAAKILSRIWILLTEAFRASSSSLTEVDSPREGEW